jgi:ATP/ADP translocase
MIRWLAHVFDLGPAEIYRIAVMASLLFLLLAANNLIKILRDSLFLGQHSVSELPYLYIIVAILAGAIIAGYTKFTTGGLPLTRLILVTNAVIVTNLVFFWFLLTYFNPHWSHYAFYAWSAIASVIAVAQLWTLANQIFTPEEGKRSFGLLTAGGTAGGVAAAFAVKGSLHFAVGSNHLLWCVAALYLSASALVFWAEPRLGGQRAMSPEHLSIAEHNEASGIAELLTGSRYVKTIAVLILVSVIVSTLIDFQFKTSAKDSYPSTEALAVYFSSYYGWLSVATFVFQVVLTGKILGRFGLNSSLYVTPGVLLTGSLAIMVWPSLLAAALTRMADATLRNSIHRSSMEILYLALPAQIAKTIKTFLDVVLERVGDATAGFIILLYSVFSLNAYISYVHFVCVALIFVWIVLIQFLGTAYSAVDAGLVAHDFTLRDD